MTPTAAASVQAAVTSDDADALLVSDPLRLTSATRRERNLNRTATGRSDGAPGLASFFTQPCGTRHFVLNLSMFALTVKMALLNNARVEQARTMTLYLKTTVRNNTKNAVHIIGVRARRENNLLLDGPSKNSELTASKNPAREQEKWESRQQ